MDQLSVLEQFFDECKDFWLRQGCSEKEAFANAIMDIPSHYPYSPHGEELDKKIVEEFRKRCEMSKER